MSIGTKLDLREAQLRSLCVAELQAQGVALPEQEHELLLRICGLGQEYGRMRRDLDGHLRHLSTSLPNADLPPTARAERQTKQN